MTPHANPLIGHQMGLGTWNMGESSLTRDAEIAAIQAGLDLGIRLIDTAEMYAEGGAERVIGAALRGRSGMARESLTIVSKVLPSNASRAGTARAAEDSIARMAAITWMSSCCTGRADFRWRKPSRAWLTSPSEA